MVWHLLRTESLNVVALFLEPASEHMVLFVVLLWSLEPFLESGQSLD